MTVCILNVVEERHFTIRNSNILLDSDIGAGRRGTGIEEVVIYRTVWREEQISLR